MEELTPISLRQASVCPKTTEVCTLAGRMVTVYSLVSTGVLRLRERLTGHYLHYSVS
jgi:hypothetical protein